MAALDKADDTPKKMESQIDGSEPRNTLHSIEQFKVYLENLYSLRIPESYDGFHQWSIENLEPLWEAVTHFCEIKMTPWVKVLENEVLGAPPPKWFIGSKLNYAENLLRFRDERIALVVTGESSGIRRITYSQLYNQAFRFAASLAALGVCKDDVIAGYLPNSEIAIVAMLGSSWLGACWTSASPDFGVQGVFDRFSRAKPKILFTVNGVIYNGKKHGHLEKVAELASKLDTVEKVVICQNVEDYLDFEKVPKSISLGDFLALGEGTDSLEFAQVPFDHPLFTMYTSGTTGPPKCMVHSVGGTLVKHLQEHKIQSNMTRQDVMLFYTTTGWMMWNWSVSSLALGCTLVLYDGSPLMPTKARLWDLVDQIGITILGTSPRWLSVLEEQGIEPRKTHSLATLRTIMSTGAPLRSTSFEYVHRAIKDGVIIASISGGTDIIGVFMGQNYSNPRDYGRMQLYLGVSIECWDNGIKANPGESGDLVLTKPLPSLPIQFLDDPDFSTYRSSYYSNCNHVWSHGDYCCVSEGGVTILGRSDAVLNPSGVRFGASEIYTIVENVPGVADSLCVSQIVETMEEKVILFVKIVEGHVFTEIQLDIKKRIREALSARHVPHLILETRGIPYTSSGKKMELLVKNILSHLPVKNIASVANPECLSFYHGLVNNIS